MNAGGHPPVDDAVTLRRMLDISLAVAAERRTEPVLRVILDSARDLTGARYAAVGVPDGGGGFDDLSDLWGRCRDVGGDRRAAAPARHARHSAA